MITTNPWTLTRKYAKAYEAWKFEVCQGDTLKSFSQYLTDHLREEEEYE